MGQNTHFDPSISVLFSLQHRRSTHHHAEYYAASIHCSSTTIMHSCIATLLFILATLSSARNLKHFGETWSFDDMRLVDGCLDTSWGLYSWFYRARVFFDDPSDLNFTYAIVTPYTEYYPGTLTNLLEAHNYKSKSPYGVHDNELCGWWSAGTARVDGRVHGSILWKYSDLRRKTNTPDFHNFTSWKASTGDHIPPHHTEARPSDATFTVIRDILWENVPNADIYYNWATLWSIMTGICGMIAFQLALKCYADYEAKRRDSESSDDDIELGEIRVRDLSGSSMQRMDGEDYTKTPGFTIEIVKPDNLSSTSLPATPTITDPPPIYSIDGAGR